MRSLRDDRLSCKIVLACKNWSSLKDGIDLVFFIVAGNFSAETIDKAEDLFPLIFEDEIEDTPLLNICKEKVRTKSKKEPKHVRRKRLRNLGLEYYNKKGKLFKEKTLGKKCAEKCKYRCSEFSDTARQAIFDKFWAIGNRSEQWSVLTKYIEKVNVKRRTSESTQRSCNYKYFLPVINDVDTFIFGEGEMQRVCKITFSQTFSVTERIIGTAVSKYEKERSFSDRRGRHKNHARVITGSMAESVCDHVLSFVPEESRYETNELSFNRPLSIKRMYDMYNKWFDPGKYESQCATLRHYRDIVNKNFKISFRSSQ